MNPSEAGGIWYRERPDWEPPVVPTELRDELAGWIEAFRQHLTPTGEDVSVIVGKLLAHFVRPTDTDRRDEAFVESLMLDWIEDLGGYPRWAIDNACREWRRNKAWRPTIAEMIKLCDVEVDDDRRTLRMLERLAA